MTGCQADYGDNGTAATASLWRAISVQEVIIHRQECERPSSSTIS